MMSGGSLFSTALDHWLTDGIEYTDGKVGHWYNGTTDDLKQEIHEKYVLYVLYIRVYVCKYIRIV